MCGWAGHSVLPLLWLDPEESERLCVLPAAGSGVSAAASPGCERLLTASVTESCRDDSIQEPKEEKSPTATTKSKESDRNPEEGGGSSRSGAAQRGGEAAGLEEREGGAVESSARPLWRLRPQQEPRPNRGVLTGKEFDMRVQLSRGDQKISKARGPQLSSLSH